MMLLALLVIFSGKTKANEPFDNITKVNGGYFLTDENIISLANYIQELQSENTRLLSTTDILKEALKEERLFTDKLLAEKDKVISLQDEQIKDLKFLNNNSKPSLFDKAQLFLGGAGIAAAIIIIGKAL